ncbi:MAG: phosphatase PAP2 family protein [Rubrobacteraceae bacterium]
MKSVVRRIKNLDRALFAAIFRVKWPAFTHVMRAFTIVGAAGFLWGVTAGVAFLFTDLEPWSLILPWGAVASSWIIAETTKYFFDRARPFMSDTEIAPLIKTPSSSSFPSGHSATAAAGAITLSAAYPAFTPIFLLAGLLVVLSRVYLGVHYPFDVLAGVIIGAVTAGLFLMAAGLVA